MMKLLMNLSFFRFFSLLYKISKKYESIEISIVISRLIDKSIFHFRKDLIFNLYMCIIKFIV